MIGDSRHLRTALVALLALVSLAAFAEPRVLSVTGHGAVAYEPDYVDLGFSVMTRDKAYAAAQSRNLDAVAAAMNRLSQGFGIDRKDITTLGYSLEETPVYDQDGKETGRAYVSTTRMSVRLRKLDTYRSVIVALLDAGVNGIESATFGVDDRAGLREKALVAACQDAERLAKAMAASARVALVRVIRMQEQSQGPGPVYAKALGEGAESNVLSPGTQVLEATVYIEYEIR